MRLYLCGPMTGLPDYNRPAFNQAAAQLRECGYEVVNPAELENSATADYETLMTQCLELVGTCRGVATLPGAHRSPGAWREMVAAKDLDLQIHPFEMWLGWKCPSKRSTA